MLSNSDKSIIKKIQKLTRSIKQAENYLQLENAIDTFNSIKSSLNNNSKDPQILHLLSATEQLIKQKIKFFKKKAIKKLSSSSIQNIKSKPDTSNKKSQLQSHYQSQRLTSSKKYQTSQNLNQSKNKPKTKHNNGQNSFTKDFQKNSQIQHDQTYKRLKQSKSVDDFQKRNQKEKLHSKNDSSLLQQQYRKQNDLNFQLNRKLQKNANLFGNWKKMRGKNNEIQSQNYDFDDGKTQIKMNDMSRRNQNYMNTNKSGELISDELRKMMMQWMSYNSSNKGSIGNNEIGIDAIRQKLGEKVLQNEQLKNRLKYYQNENSQLKKRVLNEQRRQEDYIQSLKQKLKQYEEQAYKQEKEKKVMAQLIQQLEFKMETQQKEIATYSKQLQQALVAKQLAHSQSQSQTNNLKKQLQLLSKHQSSLQDLQLLLNQQRVNNSILLQKNSIQKKELHQLKQHLAILTNNKNALQQLLEIKLEQINAYQQEIYQLKTQLTQQKILTQNLTQKIQKYQQKESQWQRIKQNQQKRKIQKLKQVKLLLTQQI